MEISLPSDALLYVPESKKPLLFRLHESLTEPSGDLHSKGVISGVTPPSRPTLAFLRLQCDPVAHIGNWGGTNSPWISTTTDFAYITFEADRRTAGPRKGDSNTLYITVIDAARPSIKGRCISGTNAIAQCSNRSDEEYSKAWNFARCFSEVLVYRCVPADAIVHTFKWNDLKDAFPEFVEVTVDTRWSRFGRYNEIIQKKLKSTGKYDSASDRVISHGICLIHDIFHRASNFKHLQVQKKYATAFCTALLEWLKIMPLPGQRSVEESITDDSFYSSKLLCIEKNELEPVMDTIAAYRYVLCATRQVARHDTEQDVLADLRAVRAVNHEVQSLLAALCSPVGNLEIQVAEHVEQLEIQSSIVRQSQ